MPRNKKKEKKKRGQRPAEIDEEERKDSNAPNYYVRVSDASNSTVVLRKETYNSSALRR